jgi:dihydroorotate dehydrogenase
MSIRPNMYSLFWKFAQKFDPECIHHSTLHVLHTFPQLAKLWPSLPNHATQGFHIRWNNPIGIAAGLDKNALALDFWNTLNIGCIEVGTVTPNAQFGNDLPRVFRLPNQSLRNAMGFPNHGANALLKRIQKFRSFHKNSIPLWVNLGKQKDTTLLDAHKDYAFLIQKFGNVADALVINISSPNTPELRKLQTEDYLESLLHILATTRNQYTPKCPLLLKISPDEEESFYLKLPFLLKKHQWQGIIATNTTAQHNLGLGGVSGVYLFEKSYAVAKMLAPFCHKLELDFVFAGGLHQKKDFELLQSLNIKFFQIYTGFIYQGPKLLFDLIS